LGNLKKYDLREEKLCGPARSHSNAVSQQKAKDNDKTMGPRNALAHNL